MSDNAKAWQCIGCGSVEAPQTCIGICQDRKVEFVYAQEYEGALTQLDAVRGRASALEAFARRLAQTKPHDAAWEDCYRRFQEEARGLLTTLPGSIRDKAGAPA